MGTVEPGPELAADALGQLGGTEALDGFLGHLPLPLQRDGRRAHPRDALDDLRGEGGERMQGWETGAPRKNRHPSRRASPSYEERSPVKAKTPLQFHRPQNQSSAQRKASKNTRRVYVLATLSRDT